MSPRLEQIVVEDGGAPGGRRTVGYAEWGAADNPRVALCVHGMTRNGRDFDALAQALAASHRVIALDVAGRGRSDWLAAPARYRIETYVGDVLALRAALGVTALDWIGTSMGGVLGMALAGAPDESTRTLIRRLVLNDVGPFLPGAAMTRIAEYVGRAPDFPDLAAAEAYQREVCAAWGALAPAQWAHLARHAVVEAPGGGFRAHYDPAIGEALRARWPIPDLAFWPLWDNVGCPTLVVRGAESDILPRETARDMTLRGPKAALLEVPGIGHAPALMDPFQIGAIRGWLDL